MNDLPTLEFRQIPITREIYNGVYNLTETTGYRLQQKFMVDDGLPYGFRDDELVKLRSPLDVPVPPNTEANPFSDKLVQPRKIVWRDVPVVQSEEIE